MTTEELCPITQFHDEGYKKMEIKGDDCPASVSKKQPRTVAGAGIDTSQAGRSRSTSCSEPLAVAMG